MVNHILNIYPAFNLLYGWVLEYTDYIPFIGEKLPQAIKQVSSVLGMTLNWIWWWSYWSEDLDSAE